MKMMVEKKLPLPSDKKVPQIFLKKKKIGPNHVKTEVAKFLPTFTTSEDSTGLSSEEVVAEIEALVELFSELCWITPSAVAL
jgi:hypothetical protein